MKTVKELASKIRNIRFRFDSEKRAGFIDFDFEGQVVSFKDCIDIVLFDNDESRRWIAQNYGFVLSNLA